MKNRILKSLLTVALFVTMQQESFAGFPIGSGRWLLVPTYTHYTADGYWKPDGTSTNFDNNGQFQSDYFGLYGGYGIDRDWDLVFNLPYVTNTYSTNGVQTEQLSAMGDAKIGLTYFLNHYDYTKHLSVTGSLIIPLYDNLQTQLLPGLGSVGIEAKIGFAGTNTKSMKNVYYDLEGGFRNYFSSTGPFVFFANATVGVPLGEDWKISGTLNYVSSSSGGTNVSTSAIYNPYINKDYSYLRGSLALGRRLDRNISLYASIFRDFNGTNIGQGQGFSVFAVIKF